MSVRARKLDIAAPTGRALFLGLEFEIDDDKVAVIGRNGAGKSTLLAVLAGDLEPAGGAIEARGEVVLVGQTLEHGERSPGEARLAALESAFAAEPDLLLLDEPSQDLDANGRRWLIGAIASRDKATVVVSHDRQLLEAFDAFCICSETGCRLFRGTLAELESELETSAFEEANRYQRKLNRMVTREQRSAVDAARRRRKKNLGRVHEIKRAPSRTKLNSKRSYAQESQARRAKVRQKKTDVARRWARAARRAVPVDFALNLALARLPKPDIEPNIVLDGVSHGGLFGPVDLEISRQRVGVVGRNGAGKSTLLGIASGAVSPESGSARRRWRRVGVVEQGAANWQLSESLIELLAPECGDFDEVADVLSRSRFPFALAERPLRSLSPGERTRAALVCLFRRSIETLIVDEPSASLDFLGASSLTEILASWPGGLLIASHDRGLLDRVKLDRLIDLDATRDSRPDVTAEPCRD